MNFKFLQTSFNSLTSSVRINANLHFQPFPQEEKMKRIFVTCLSLLLVNAASAASFYRTDEPLSQAHAAFVAGDSLKMMTALRDSLMAQPYDQQIKKNALGLYQQAMAKNGVSGLPADWKLPEEITRMKIAVRHVENESSKFQLKVSGTTKEAGVIQQFQVTRYPDQIVMDKENKIGTYEEAISIKGEHEYDLQSLKSNKPLATGLYLLKCVLTSGKTVDGWFLIDEGMNSTTVPKVQAPSMDQVFTSGTPTFRWSNFQSPQYQPNEVRSLWVGIFRTDLGNDWVKSWEKWLRAPALQELTVGLTKPDAGVNELENGQYMFVVNYHETRNFGDVSMVRDAVTDRPFKVQK